MKTFIRRHTPNNKATWLKYLKTIIPIIAGSTLFALNGVVDNFMVGHIEQGQTALGAINSWTSIAIGILVGTAAVGSVLIGQFYYTKKYEVVKEIVRYRYLLAYIFVLPIAIFAWIAPDVMTRVFYSGKPDSDGYELVLENARRYARIIAIQWLLICISFNMGNQLREIGYGKHTMIYGFGTLGINILFNSILMYGANMGVEGAAIASCMGRVLAIIYCYIVIKKKKLAIGFNPLTIFQTSRNTKKLFWKRWVYFLALATVFSFIQFRNTFYSMGYQGGAYALGKGVSGMSIVALTGALVNVFFTAMSALSAMAAIFVGSELGNNNLKQARINSDQVKGFNTIVALFLSLILIIFAFLIPHLHFLAENKYDKNGKTFDGDSQLLNVRNASFVLAFFYPTWVWFSSSYRNGNSGGRGSYFAIIDWTITGLQVGWAAIVMVGIVPHSTLLQNNFWISYAIFFLSDLLKLVFIEIYYYRSDKWLHSITTNEVVQIKNVAQDLDAEVIKE